MAIKKFKPVTPSLRFRTVSDVRDLDKKEPERALIRPHRSRGGRNNTGRVTVRGQGGGHKRRYRVIDFKRDKLGVPAKVTALEYDPNRSARIALLQYADGAKRYILAPLGLSVGDAVVSAAEGEIQVGNALPLDRIPLGTTVHNVELKPGRGGQMARSAGAEVQLMAKEGKLALLRLPSGEIRNVLRTCRATIGQVGNVDHENLVIGKAGANRWRGVRPTVRGVAKNPHDHPMGGGEGKSSGGRHPCTPWGKPTKGFKTRKRKKTSNRLIVRRRSKRRRG